MQFKELLKIFKSNKKPKICTDSRLVKKGDCFIAIKGTKYNGHNFLNNLVDKKPGYIVSEMFCNAEDAELIIVNDTADALAKLAHTAAANPCRKLINLAVTGTNGKTTVAAITRNIINTTGQKAGLIGTIEYNDAEKNEPASLTTPDPIKIANLAARMVKNGAKYMVTEASSHALAQKRLNAIKFRAAAFTNITGDHLDYHKTQEQYLAAKKSLFENLDTDAFAIINRQSDAAQKIANATKAKIIYYAIEKPETENKTDPHEITAKIIETSADKTTINIKYAGQAARITTPLIGKHNVSNILAATGLCLAAGLSFQQITKALANIEPIPGRLQQVPSKAKFNVLIDYAHTDDALENVLQTLQPICNGKLTLVFGCGGNRDRSKRQRMAKVAQKLADKIIVTSDNPRYEKPENIIDDIKKGFSPKGLKKTTFETDRKTAIETAIKNANPQDVILIAGKGHETYQIIGKKRIKFSDSETARKILKKFS
jgi:UDP-N-acetylmuramoyl-L-alanyl-D-glutamate--2,6-diaminopimelate ligase